MARNRNLLPNNLPQLQNLIKRDPAAYRDEFHLQYQHYKALLQLFLLNPSQQSEKLEELVMFISQVIHCYPEEMATYPEELQGLLRKNSTVLDPGVRMTLCKGLILMRNKDILSPHILLPLFFELFRCSDKLLRSTLYGHIVSDIKRLNHRHKNNKVNTTLQNFMYTMLQDSNKMAAKMSLDVIMELYRKNIWNDAKTVNVISTACFSPISKIMVAAVSFFLHDDNTADDDASSDSESEFSTSRAMMVSKQTLKKGKKRERKVAKALSLLEKHKKKKRKCLVTSFSALHLINDPQDFAEKLFKKLDRSTERFEARLLIMNLISRLIGVHQLFLLNFYPFLQRYLQPHQQEVTKILTFLAQASHELVPPEVLEPAIKTVVNNFVTERNSEDAMAIGLNTVREVCVRTPLVMTHELLQDLAMYKTHRDRGVAMAARSLIQLFRTVNPDLLHKKDRGHPSQLEDKKTSMAYGELKAESCVPGSELLDLVSGDTAAGESDLVSGDIAAGEGDGLEDSNHDDDGEDLSIHDDDDLGSHDDSEEEDASEGEWEDDSHSIATMETSTTSIAMGYSRVRKSDRKRQRKAQRLREKKEAVTAIEGKVSSGRVGEEERKERASNLVQSRFLTQEEFEEIRRKRLLAQLDPNAKGMKRGADEMTGGEDDTEDWGRGELVSEAQIENVYKRHHRSKEEKLASVQAGREGREKYGVKKGKLNPQSSTTNKEKLKTKAYTMIVHKKKSKSKRSFREKQQALKASLLKDQRRR